MWVLVVGGYGGLNVQCCLVCEAGSAGRPDRRVGAGGSRIRRVTGRVTPGDGCAPCC